MPDREKVIKGLECCKAYEYKCNDCPYADDELESGCNNEELITDALSLIQDQRETIDSYKKLLTWSLNNVGQMER